MAGSRWARDLRLTAARLPSLRMGRVPDAPALPVRDQWPGDPARGARLLRGELQGLGHQAGHVRSLKPGGWSDPGASATQRAQAHGFVWLRDLRALGTDGARMRARALTADWIAGAGAEPMARRPDVAGNRIAAWLGHYDFFAASADDAFRQRLMGRLVTDARALAAALPTEELDARALTALKGLVAAAVALPEHTGFLTRALRFLPQELARAILPDGCHVERSPAAQLVGLQELVDIRAMLVSAQVALPPALPSAIERMSLALRALRHGDGGLALFNGAREEQGSLIELVLNQAGRAGRAPVELRHGGFQRLVAGRSLVVVDCGAPPAPGLDRLSHAGTLAIEVSIGRDRLIVNCGTSSAPGWHDAMRATAAHSTLTIADTASSELKPAGLGRRVHTVELQRQEANGAHWLEASHDGYLGPFGVLHRRRLYLAESGEDIRGEDAIEAAGGGEPADGHTQPYALRFHLHPNVTASLQQDGEAVLLRIASGGWRLRAEGAKLTLEESVYLGGSEPRRAEQVVLTGHADGPQQVKWAITKVG